jgi:hypothetical protein
MSGCGGTVPLLGTALPKISTAVAFTMSVKSTTAGVAQANRELVAHEFVTTTGENERTADETCPLLLAVVSREPSNKAIVWHYAPADHWTVASARIAKGVGAWESIQIQKGKEVRLTKPDGKAVHHFWDLRWGEAGPYVAPWVQRKSSALESLDEYILWDCWELKRKFRLRPCNGSNGLGTPLAEVGLGF